MRKIIAILITVFIVVNILLSLGINFFIDWLWFESLGFSNSFWTIIQSKISVRLGTWLFISTIILVNLFLTRKKVINFWQRIKTKHQQGKDVIEMNPMNSNKWAKLITPNRINIVYILISLFIGFIFSNFGGWKIILKFINSTSFNKVDPIFQNDIGFYVFKLPFYNLSYQLAMFSLVIAGVISGIVYLITASGDSLFSKLNDKHIKYHLSILLSIFFLLKAWGYRLDMYQLLYSGRGVAFGASYTDINARLLALKILSVITIIIAIFVFTNIFFKNLKFIIGGVVTLVLVSVLVGGIYPQVIQQFVVEPNEIAKETPYLKYNIKFTRQAYNLDNIEERNFPVKEELSYKKIVDNKNLIGNIRLWDKKPLKATYSQLQEIKSYYNFKNIDIDRYKINGKLKQVMLSARELNQDSLANRAQTWVNKRLVFTHGFGVAMSPVNKVTPSGLPKFLIKDIPPESTEINITQPRIYYGEANNGYAIVDTKAKEFDYPKGDINQYTNYQGSGGIKLNTFFKKIIFALKYQTLKIFLNEDITNDSQLMLRRNINKRIRRVAPFLRYDADPYLVISKAGKLYWVQDAYTTTSLYPYSEPQTWGNYIRNSVKVVVNAYSGKMKFYVVDQSDPIIQTYDKIFPELFVSANKMPQDIKKHLRYPKGLFNIQADVYKNYHMQNPRVFYNKEDLWSIPQQTYARRAQNNNSQRWLNSIIEVQPYYALFNLPQEKEASMLLMLPFTPFKKNNMISWLAAKPNGKLVLYEFPKQKLTYGPMQIESRIDQDSSISKQLSLWNQRGSEVIRGNLLTIPVNKSLLYIEPIYLQAEQSELPELKRVVVATSDDLAMATNLRLALQKLFGIKKEFKKDIPIEEAPLVKQPTTIKKLIVEANQLYKEAQTELKAGNWSKYGQLIKKLKDKLKKLKTKVK
nr:UPF0182 family protein [Halobacteroides halobius]